MPAIERVRIVNVKRIEDVDLHPGPGLFEIGGLNGAGKSSILDAIEMAIGGKRSECPEPLRSGEAEGSVAVTLDDGLTITRRWKRRFDGTVADSELQIVTSDGALVPRMQTVLDALTGKTAIDPVAFLRAPPKKQVEDLRKLVGLDLTALDGKRAWLLSTKADAATHGKAAAAVLGSMPPVAPVPARVSIDGLVAEMEVERKARSDFETASRRRIDALAVESRARETLASLRRQIAEAELAVENAQRAAAAIVVPDEPAKSDLGASIAAATEANAAADRAYRALAARAAQEERVEGFRATWLKATTDLEALDARRTQELAAARFPVEGLGFGEEGVTLHGLPFEQGSSAKQIEVSLAMAMAASPKLRLVLIRDGSLLDRSSLGRVAALALEAGYQVLVEKVGDIGGAGVVIEDGRVATANGHARTQVEVDAQLALGKKIVIHDITTSGVGDGR